ncbi:glycoside hydrolase, superfamily [Trichoderma arundinaceum]|uniref:Glycoside hydrolase, superfamily n=1 Tax=Trichoderma arundinaceum TaxID=490622 RepID=A0A395NH57_TRIAR|nr:glycoside hydrolase, superfamily [Trichoderma arundinaceum]
MEDLNINSISEQDLLRAVGNLFLVSFDGTTLTYHLRQLIQGHFVGAILLTSKNLKSGSQATELISSLQWCAHAAGHRRPLLIAIDQENGSLNSVVDNSITQFPSAMGIAANASPRLTRQVATATASELRAIGVNWILGPVLDVLAASRPSPLGVRAFGDDPITVLTHGLQSLYGFKEAGIACCGKHFPSYGDVEFADGTEFSLPNIPSSLEDLENRGFIPFCACAQSGMDAMLVGGCTLNNAGNTTKYACLDRNIVSNILRIRFRFNGVILSECLAMEALCQDIGITQGVIMAARAGCDMITICQSNQAQLEGITALVAAVKDGSVLLKSIWESNDRINAMKDGCTSWEQALNPQAPTHLAALNMKHSALSNEAYTGAISLIRDTDANLSRIRECAEILLLTPLVGLFPSTATRESSYAYLTKTTQLAPGEDRFQGFGNSLAEILETRVTHTSYSSNGLRPKHEDLISRASAVIILTADAIRNSYQYGVTKHVNMQCCYQTDSEGRQKPLVVVALSSPYDFLADKDIKTYICTYDFTTPSLNNLAQLLAGKLTCTKNVPLASAEKDITKSIGCVKNKMKATWLVEAYNKSRDRLGLEELLSRTPVASQFNFNTLQPLDSAGDIPEQKYFVCSI